MAKKIVLVTSGQPTLNPRLLKEADALADAGYEVTVLYSYWNAWGAAFDSQLLPTKKWKAICAGGNPEQDKLTYFLSRLFYKIANKIKSKSLIEFAVARPAYYLIREAKKHQADLYIGHNLGALPAVVIAAKANNKPCGFDAEDFHRNETSDDANNADVLLKSQIEDKYLPQLNYFSTSSPQIADAYKTLYPALNPIVLLNVFRSDDRVKNRQVAGGPIKLFWFSQTIGANRGLQDVVGALRLLDKAHFELHILGSTQHSDPAFIDELTNSGISLTFQKPVHPDELTAFAAQFDIGLALEPGFAMNNNLALSNKIFTYMQAGLAIIASNTAAQQDLLKTNPSIGYAYPKGNITALAAILSSYHTNRSQLTYNQNEALRLAHEQYNWEMESQKFLDLVRQTLSPKGND
jgi:glycosyltransferase involved in cell wall biosynthesis